MVSVVVYEWAEIAERSEHVAAPDGWAVLKIDQDDLSKTDAAIDRVHLKNGNVLDHIGYGLTYLGRLESPNGGPGLLFSGKECVDCKEGVRLFLYSTTYNQVATFGYPAGSVSDYDGEAQYSGRAFLGKCATNFDGVIAFGKMKQDDGSWRATIQLYSFEPDGSFTAKLADRNSPEIADTLRRAGKDDCKELPGVDYREAAPEDPDLPTGE